MHTFSTMPYGNFSRRLSMAAASLLVDDVCCYMLEE